MFDLQFTTIWPYFVLMSVFCAEAHIIQRTCSFFRSALVREIADTGRSTGLDGLRGLLALGVFFTHAQTFHEWFATGKWTTPSSNFYAQLGVAPVGMFFLITGFLFWTKAQRRTVGSLQQFFRQRLRRLLPAYLLACLLIGLVVATETRFRREAPWASLLLCLFSFLTFLLVPGGSPNGYANTTIVYANVFWSLRVEWMFYLIFPFLATFARKRIAQLALIVISVIGIFWLPVLRVHLGAARMPGAFGLGTIQYFDFYFVSYFSFGIFISFCKEHLDLRRVANNGLTTFAAVAAIVALMAHLPPKSGVLEGAMLALPLLLITFGNSFFGLLRVRSLVLLGQVSYSTYLLHGITLFVAYTALNRYVPIQDLPPLGFWLLTALVGIVVVALSALSYRYLEAPFMKGYGTPQITVSADTLAVTS